jgi:hypothetical protein
MKRQKSKAIRSIATQNSRYRIRLPGFISDADIGLGDAIKRATSAFGIRACAGCERRTAALNKWLSFTSHP